MAESSVSAGGAALDVSVSFSHFSECTSKAEGGALHITGALVVAHVQHTEIESCLSDAAGGAISSSGLSSLSLMACKIHDNSAQGMGGGALHLNTSYLSSYNTSIRNNRAPWGGGGALLWQGWVQPATIALDCPTETVYCQSSCTEEATVTDRAACRMQSCSPVPMPSNILNISAHCSLCGPNNSALYGQFIASDYKKLHVSEITETVFTGVPFNFTVTKQDAYGNPILSDSSSVLEATPASNRTQGLDQRTTVLGSAVSRMSDGAASFLFAVKAAFSRIDYVRQSVSLFAPIFLSITGQDLELGVQMESGWVPIPVQQGVGVCPRGYILVPDQDGEVNGSAMCTLCRPGFYSLSPLAQSELSGSSINSPSCLSCPAGCKCAFGGADIHCEPGEWKAVDGVFRLTSCPAGSQLINSTTGTSQGPFSNNLQQCKACLPGQYIINPDTDTCQDCPPGSQIFACCQTA